MNQLVPAFRFSPLPLILGATLLAACSSDGDGDGEATGGMTASGGSGTGGGAATGGSATGGGDGGGDDQMPPDKSSESIAAFLTAGTYKTWTHEAAPRGKHPDVLSSYHANEATGEMMQVYFNDLAVMTHGGAAIGAMTVKEFYDAAGTQVGIAAALKTTDRGWTFYCMDESTSKNRCEDTPAASYPIYQVDEFLPMGCARCHGDLIVTPLP